MAPSRLKSLVGFHSDSALRRMDPTTMTRDEDNWFLAWGEFRVTSEVGNA
jgi:hypothetical protein